MALELKLAPEYFFPLSADRLFCDLTAKSRLSLNRIQSARFFRKSECLFSAGEAPRRVYFMRRGAALVRLTDQRTEMTLVRLTKPDEILGLTETIANASYRTSAESFASCLCECVRREDFIRFLREEPEICFRLAAMLGSRFQKSCELFCSAINYQM